MLLLPLHSWPRGPAADQPTEETQPGAKAHRGRSLPEAMGGVHCKGSQQSPCFLLYIPAAAP